MFFRKENKEVFFIHIPRTGGRFLKEQLNLNHFQLRDKFKSKFFLGKEICHLDRARNKGFYQNIFNDFAIIRNPIEKFASSWYYINELENILNISFNNLDYDEFEYMMEKIELIENSTTYYQYNNIVCGLKNYANNWFLPQYKFIFSTTKLWKFENGINEQFLEWLNYNFNLNLKFFNKTNFLKDEYDQKITLEKLSNKLKNNITRYYKKDIELWNQL